MLEEMEEGRGWRDISEQASEGLVTNRMLSDDVNISNTRL